MSAPSSSVRSTFFDRWSATYDRRDLQDLTYRPIHDAMLRRLGPRRPTSVLDLGCGTGQFIRRLAVELPAATIHGIDLSSGMLAEAADRTRDTTGGLVLGDAQRLPFPPDSFDAVTCSESFHWYPDQRSALRELASVVRPGGQLLIASVAAATNAGDRAMRWLSNAAGQPLRALPPRRLAALLEEAGFEVVDQRRVPRLGLIPWPVLTDARRAGRVPPARNVAVC